MAIGTFTLTGNLTTYANLERAAGYGSLIIRAIPDSTPVPAERETLVQPDPFPIASDGTFSIELDAVAGVKYRVSTSPRSLFPSFAFDALAAGETRDLSELQTVPAVTPTVPYLIGRGVPAGGTTGQVAAKASDADYDVAWVDQTGGSGGGGAVDSVNGQTGVVVLGASDVGAQPAGSYATAAQGALADTAVQPAALTSLVDTTDPRLSDARTPTAHTHPASQVSDSTTVGRALLTAADAATARAAVGAGTSSFDGAYGSLTGKPTLGTAAATASTDYATAAQGVLAGTASQPGHTHAQTDVTGLTTALAGKAATVHTHVTSDVTGLDTSLAGKALNTVTVSAGTGLTGGGDLTANRTLAVDFAGAGVTTAGKVVNANDARLSDARTPLAHNHAGSEITSGTVAYARIPIGTTASTVAAGDDSRITGAAQKASNLSDLASASTARTNLGLGTAAVANVGTQTVNAQTGTTYTLQSSDVGKLVTLSNAAAITVTVPAVLAAGQRVDFLVIGAGLPTFVGSGVTINGYPSLVAKAQWTAFSVYCYATNALAVVGGLA